MRWDAEPTKNHPRNSLLSSHRQIHTFDWPCPQSRYHQLHTKTVAYKEMECDKMWCTGAIIYVQPTRASLLSSPLLSSPLQYCFSHLLNKQTSYTYKRSWDRDSIIVWSELFPKSDSKPGATNPIIMRFSIDIVTSDSSKQSEGCRKRETFSEKVCCRWVVPQNAEVTCGSTLSKWLDCGSPVWIAFRKQFASNDNILEGHRYII